MAIRKNGESALRAQGALPPAGEAEEQRVRIACLEAEKEILGRELETLRESEAGYRALFDRIPVGIYRTDPEGKIILANIPMVRMLGFRSFKELTERNLEEKPYEPSYDREWFKRELLKEGELKGVEATWTTTGNIALKIRENARAIRDRDGSMLYYEGTVEDITGQKDSEDVLRAKADFLEEVITNASVGIFVIDEDNQYVLINPQCGRIVGRWPDDWTGKEAGMNIHPEDQGKALAHFIQAISGEPTDFEARIQASDGSYKTCRVNLSPMMLAGRAHVLGLVQDVTAERSAEQKLLENRSFGLNTILVLAITALARKMEAAEREDALDGFRGTFAGRFQKLFEEDMHIMSSLEGSDGLGVEGPEGVLRRYLKFYSSLLRVLGMRTEVTHHGHEARFEILNCHWLDDAKLTPVPCRICRTVLCDSFGWTGLNGTAQQGSTMAAGASTCRFDFQLLPRRTPPKE